MLFLLVCSLTDPKRPSAANTQIEEFALVPQTNLDAQMHHREVECLLVKGPLIISIITKQLKRNRELM